MVVDAKIYINMRRWSKRRENNKLWRGTREDIKIVKEGIKKLRRENIKIGEERMKN